MFKYFSSYFLYIFKYNLTISKLYNIKYNKFKYFKHKTKINCDYLVKMSLNYKRIFSENVPNYIINLLLTLLIFSKNVSIF